MPMNNQTPPSNCTPTLDKWEPSHCMMTKVITITMSRVSGPRSASHGRRQFGVLHFIIVREAIRGCLVRVSLGLSSITARIIPLCQKQHQPEPFFMKDKKLTL